MKAKLLVVSIALANSLFVQNIFAQGATGYIYGTLGGESSVTIRNIDTNATRTQEADSNGRFLINLPPATYEVEIGNTKKTVRVLVGSGVRIDPNEEINEIVVFGSTRPNPIDLSTSELSTILTADDIQKLPISRDITSVALLAPGTSSGDSGFGNLASFGGSSVAENGYYINGFDVTNIRYFLSYAELPFEAISSQQIKTGGYGAEYGRSLGGVIGLVTKSGTNEWHYGASAYWTPKGLSRPGKDVAERDPEKIGTAQTKYVYRSDNTSDTRVANYYFSGPIIKDKLFIFGLLQDQHSEFETYGYSSSSVRREVDPTGLLKIDYEIANGHSLELTAIRNKEDTEIEDYIRTEGRYTPVHEDLLSEYEEEQGGHVYIAKYSGAITNNFDASLMYGELEYTNPYRASVSEAITCPAVLDSRPGASNIYPGCWDPNLFTVPDLDFGPDLDERKGIRADFEWRLGDHKIRFGLDNEEFLSGHAGQTYSGGIYYRYYSVPASGRVNGTTVPQGTNEYVRVRNYQTSSGTYKTENSAFYIEDSWQLSDSFLLSAGIRSESFKNMNGNDEAFIEANNLYAPRLGFTWDAREDGSVKVFGSYGRYFIPVSADANIRAAAGEYLDQSFYTFSSIDPKTFKPQLGVKLGSDALLSDGASPNPVSITSAGLKPMYQQEFIFGLQAELTDNWVGGVRYINRNIKNGFEDTCSHDALIKQVRSLGYPEYEGETIPTCMFFNPGKDLSILLDVDLEGTMKQVTVNAAELGYPEYKRQYHAIEFTAQGSLTSNFNVQGSYVWSHSYGNMEGYVNSSLEQADPGLTQDYDYVPFTYGSYGNLPNDRRHTLKLFGTYEAENWRLGLNASVQTGRPVNCLGFASTANMDPDLVDIASVPLYGASAFTCNLDGSGAKVVGRGSIGVTPILYNFDLQFSYTPPSIPNLTVGVDIFNVFNFRRVVEWEEQGDKTQESGEKNPNYLNHVNFQAPTRTRLSMRYDF